MRLKIIAIFYGLLVPLSLFGQGAPNKMEINPIDKTNKSERRATVSETNNYSLSQIGQVAISVGDLERATAFYRDKLGMKYLFAANGMAFFDCDGIRLMLARLDKAESSGAKFVVYFKVEDIQKGYKTLLERGVKFEEEPELAAKTEKFDLWLACFRDSENNNLCLMSEVSGKK